MDACILPLFCGMLMLQKKKIKLCLWWLLGNGVNFVDAVRVVLEAPENFVVGVFPVGSIQELEHQDVLGRRDVARIPERVGASAGSGRGRHASGARRRHPARACRDARAPRWGRATRAGNARGTTRASAGRRAAGVRARPRGAGGMTANARIAGEIRRARATRGGGQGK